MAAYALIAGIGWVALRLDRTGGAQAAGVSGPPAAAAGEMLEIRDGSRLVVAPMGDVLYARAEGNYVSVTLADGRTPLMRATLTGLEQRLTAAGGFVRTHRSWLVSLRHVRESEPTGSGDFVLRMADGGEVPLSRRYGEAVRLIRKRSGGAE